MQEHHKLQPEKSGGLDRRKTVNSEAAGQLSCGAVGNSIIQSLPIGIVIFDAELKIVENNQRAEKLLELSGHIDETLAKGASHPKEEWTKRLAAVVSTGKKHKFENLNYRYSKNSKVKLLKLVCIPLNEQAVGGAVIVEDITEKASLQRQLASAQKLASLGKIASKVAHELNNPMDGILRYINLAIRVVEQEGLEKPKDYLTQCRQGLMRMVHIISELLEFSRSTYALTEEYVKVEQIIEDAVKTMDMRIEASNIHVLRDYQQGIAQIRSGNLFQVFYNLIKNALDAMPDGGKLQISTLPAVDNNIIVEFSDTGIGFAPENAEALFEPFFTTKDKGKGTGLGLAICKDIVEKRHGKITAENTADGGSVFTVYLPVANEDV